MYSGHGVHTDIWYNTIRSSGTFCKTYSIQGALDSAHIQSFFHQVIINVPDERHVALSSTQSDWREVLFGQ